ncbi:MAG: VapC toxin family PIN domain ribonuclease [Nitrospinae bacterium CG11_big_fil_rev_8_21_14_0_20_56_8]|nr:MAG: VapC toxin family PIN domain ribonuclease [Nitrospinae bacterium CG11_big_fil_rev_8_21_14_0_20_56_8]
MVLVDTSIWVSHLRKGEVRLEQLLDEGVVCCHPFVIGELACGNFQNRKNIVSLLQALPQTEMAGDEEVLTFIEQNQLLGQGIGYVDVHLLASAKLSRAALWTADKALLSSARKLGLLPR